MNAATLVVLAVLILITGSVLRTMYQNAKQGKHPFCNHGCCSDCCGQCGKKETSASGQNRS